MNWIENLRPLHDRLLVKKLQLKKRLIEVIRDNPHMADMIAQGMNGEHDDNRRVFLMSRVVSVGNSVRGVKKGDMIVHSAWNDLPPWLNAPKEYAMIRENDVAGHADPEAMGYEA